MTQTPAEFDELLVRMRRGDRTAMAELVSQYEREVRIVARAHIGLALRPHLDSVDLVQSVHRSLMIGLRNDKFDISTPKKLLALAVTIVRRKAARHWRRIQRQQRLSGMNGQTDSLTDLLISFRSSPVDPAAETALRDTTNQILCKLEDTDRQLIQLRLEGYNTADAARELGLDPDVIRVRLSRLRQRLRENGLAANLI